MRRATSNVQHIAVYQDFIADSFFFGFVDLRHMATRICDRDTLERCLFFFYLRALFQYVISNCVPFGFHTDVLKSRGIKKNSEISNMQKFLCLVNINYYLVRLRLLLISFTSGLNYLTSHCCLQK